MASAADRVPRLLAMSAWLSGIDEVSLQEVASEFAITPAQARDDITMLAMSEVPGQWGFYLLDVDLEALEQGIVRPSSGHAPEQPARFSADEAITLLAGLRTLAETATADNLAAIESAGAKIAAVAAEHAPAAEAISVSVTSAGPELRDAIAEAIRTGMRTRLVYVDARGRESLRMVDPHGTRVVDGYHYLDAFDVYRGGWRSFRMDRITDAHVTEEPADDHDGAPSGEPGWVETLAAAQQVRLLVRPGARWITEYYPTTDVRPATGQEEGRAGDGSEGEGGDLVVTLGVLDPEWLTGLLLRCGPDATLLDPAGADEGARRSAEATLGMYRRRSMVFPDGSAGAYDQH